MDRRSWIFVVALTGCDKGTPPKPPAPPPAPRDAAIVVDAAVPDPMPVHEVMIRACNATKYDFKDLRFHGADDGPLAKGGCTPYRAAGTMYGYTDASFHIGKDLFAIQPIDYVGETPLANGSWSYQITISDYAKREADIGAKKN